MSEQATSAGLGQDREARLREELHRSQEEVLRLRDMLIAKDAELGTAKGKLAELTEHSAQIVAVVHRVRARLLVPLRRVVAVLRRRG
jgi:hypothetical protein